MMPHGRHVNSLATPYHMPIFDALALVRSPHLRGLATLRGTSMTYGRARGGAEADCNGVSEAWGGTSCSLTLYIPTEPNEL